MFDVAGESPVRIGQSAPLDRWIWSGTYADEHLYVICGAEPRRTREPEADLCLYNVADPQRPILVARVEHLKAAAVAVAGGFAYMACASYRWGELSIYDVATPSAPRWVSSVPLRGAPVSVAASGTHAYVALQADQAGLAMGQQPGLVVIDAAEPSSPQVVGFLPVPIAPAEASSVTPLAVLGTMVYVGLGGDILDDRGVHIVGSWGAVQFIDAAQPSAPRLVSTLDGLDGAVRTIGVLADSILVVLTVASERYPMTLAPAASTLRTVDVRDIEQPAILGTITIEEASDGLALVGPRSIAAHNSGNLWLADLADARAPRTIGSFAVTPFVIARAVDAADGQAHVVAWRDHVGGTGWHADALAVDGADSTTLSISSRVEVTVPPDWLSDDVVIASGLTYVAKGGAVLVLDMTAPGGPRRVATMGDSFGVPLRLAASPDGLLAIGRHIDEIGLRLIDTRIGPTSEVGRAAVATYGVAVGRHGTVFAVTDCDGRGYYPPCLDAFALQPGGARSLGRVGRIDLPDHLGGLAEAQVAVAGDAVVVGDVGLAFFDARDPRSMRLGHVQELGIVAYDASASGTRVFVAGERAVDVYDVADADAPELIARAALPFQPAGIAADGPDGAWITNEAGLWRVAFGRPWQ